MAKQRISYFPLDKMEDEINDAMKGTLPAAWSEALKEYYKKLAAE